MTFATLALQIVDTLLLAVIAVWCISNGTKLEWLKVTLIPFLTSLSRFINREKK